VKIPAAPAEGMHPAHPVFQAAAGYSPFAILPASYFLNRFRGRIITDL